MLIARDNDTGDKLFTSVNDAGNKLSPVFVPAIDYGCSVVVTGD